MRARRDLEDALLKGTDLQERLASAEGCLVAAESERRALEERLAESSAAGAGLRRALEKAEAGRAGAVTAAEGLREQLGEAAVEAALPAVGELLPQEGAARLDEQAARLREEVSRASEDSVALLRRAGEAATARLGEVSAAKEELEGRVAELERAREEGRVEAARREAELEAERAAESERLHRVLDDIEADHAAGNRTVAELRQGLADVHGIGAELGEKLISVVTERNDILARLEVADGALAASAADRRRLERELEASAAAAEELRREKDKGLSNVEELQKVGTW